MASTASSRMPSYVLPQSSQSSISGSSTATAVHSAASVIGGASMSNNSLFDHQSNKSESILSRTLTVNSMNSQSTVNTVFDSQWLPNSHVMAQERIKLSLKLNPSEIATLRFSWSQVISNASSINMKTMKSNSNANGNTFIHTSSSDPSADSKNQRKTIVTASTSTTSGGFASSLFCIQFYQNFIGLDPEIETLIPSIRHQASAFAGVINVAINTLEDLSKMDEYLERLGRLHARILGIDSIYFQMMGIAFIKTFRDRYSNDTSLFTPELEEAWTKLYTFLANSIIQGGLDPVIEYGDTYPQDLTLGSLSISNTSGAEIEPSISNQYSTNYNSAPNADDLASTKASVNAPSTSRSYMPHTSSSLAHETTKKSPTPPGSMSSPNPALKSNSFGTNNFASKVKSTTTATSRISRLKRGGKGTDDENCVIM
ncbi:hypothetical protein B5S28_g2199 [[Candida] boidinii]|nr:hypothetical protein B5S28_g2199 [[Candida] boidinii]OWB60381.1 hypothetical protein B5S29_g1255 [[Candida] boidinii]OWB73001.1 hypothetical protein B5S31_g2731 [[Candida] boidinii]